MATRLKTSPRIHLRTHAKVNLFLRVIARRPDGYHELETILHGIELGDEIHLDVIEAGRIEVEMEVEPQAQPHVPSAEENIVWRVANRLVERGITGGVRIRVVKRIPMGAGLGGGSGNAAGVLVALNELWSAGLDRDSVLEIAAGLGSDVSYCISGGTVLATARGEKLTSLPAPQEMWFVLGVSDTPLLTREVYEAFDALETPSHPQPTEEITSSTMALALGAGDVEDVASLLHNDLERAAFILRPELEEKKQLLVDAGALGACVSGSGPTVYGIAPDEDSARKIAESVRGSFDRVLTVRSRAECIERLS